MRVSPFFPPVTQFTRRNPTEARNCLQNWEELQEVVLSGSMCALIAHVPPPHTHFIAFHSIFPSLPLAILIPACEPWHMVASMMYMFIF